MPPNSSGVGPGLVLNYSHLAGLEEGCKESNSASAVLLERIDGRFLSAWPNERFELAPVRHIDTDWEEIRQILGNGDVLEEINRRVGRDLNHDVNVAVVRIVATSPAAEQGSVSYTARPEGGLVLLQRGDDVFPFHVAIIAKTEQGWGI